MDSSVVEDGAKRSEICSRTHLGRSGRRGFSKAPCIPHDVIGIADKLVSRCIRQCEIIVLDSCNQPPDERTGIAVLHQFIIKSGRKKASLGV